MMSELASTALLLREVKAAQEMFLTLWALDEMTNKPQVLDRVARDVENAADEAELFNSHNSVWLAVQRGRNLDD